MWDLIADDPDIESFEVNLFTGLPKNVKYKKTEPGHNYHIDESGFAFDVPDDHLLERMYAPAGVPKKEQGYIWQPGYEYQNPNWDSISDYSIGMPGECKETKENRERLAAENDLTDDIQEAIMQEWRDSP